MTEEKLAFLKLEDASQDELDMVSSQVEEALPDNYNFILTDDRIMYADPEEMMEMFLSMFHFIEANCFEDKAEAHAAMNPDQENLKDVLIESEDAE